VPQDTADVFARSLMHLEKMYDYYTIDYEKKLRTLDNKIIVMTHHAPHDKSVRYSPNYSGSAIDYAFFSDLNDWIRSRPQIIAWVHGHTHKQVDYKVDACNIVSNPRGYGPDTPNYDECFDNFKLKSLGVFDETEQETEEEESSSESSSFTGL